MNNSTQNIKPEKGKFVEMMVNSLTYNIDTEGACDEQDKNNEADAMGRVVKKLYKVLFEDKLSDFTVAQISFLSKLLHDTEQKEVSSEFFKTMKILFPDIAGFLDKLSKNRNFIPPKKEAGSRKISSTTNDLVDIYGNRIVFVQSRQQTLFELFNDFNAKDVLRQEVWETLLEHVKEKDINMYYFISEKVSVHSYSNFLGKLTLSMTNEKDQMEFEENYVKKMQDFFKEIGYRLWWIDYTIKPNKKIIMQGIGQDMAQKKQPKHNIIYEYIQELNEVRITPKQCINPYIETISEPLNQAYKPTNYCDTGSQKVISQLILGGKHFFLGGENIGKSHIIQAFVRELRDDMPHKKIVYTTGARMANEIMRCLKSDQNNNNRVETSAFFEAFQGVDKLVIDDFDALGWEKKYTQYVINKISKITGMQIIMVSKVQPIKIGRHYGTKGNNGKGLDYKTIDLFRQFGTDDYIELNEIDIGTKEQVIDGILSKCNNLLLTDELKKGIKYTLVRTGVKSNLYRIAIKSIMNIITSGYTLEDVPSKIFEIIKNVTGAEFSPEKKDIYQVIKSEINNTNRKSYIKESTDIDIGESKISEELLKEKTDNPAVKVALCLCIYFIRKYQTPIPSYDDIGEHFGRTGSSISVLYKEAKSWMQNKRFERYFDTQIKIHLNQKYGFAPTK